MKGIFLFIGVLLIVAACSMQKSTINVERNSGDITDEDSVEYCLETFDTRFESWYQFHNSPALYRSQSYYEGWNRQYVSAWNAHVVSGYKSSFFEPIIGYEPHVDYGFELNHELFYYFQYVEKVLKIEIMPVSPKAVLL